jgi:hypothetical protein
MWLVLIRAHAAQDTKTMAFACKDFSVDGKEQTSRFLSSLSSQQAKEAAMIAFAIFHDYSPCILPIRLLGLSHYFTRFE